MPSNNFAEALNVTASEVERPPIAPLGHYRWKISQSVMGDASSPKGSWDTLEFRCKAVEARDDVDPEALSAVGGISMVTGRVKFMFDKGDDPESVAKFDRSKYNLTRFLTEHCGMDESKSLRELIDGAKGQEFLGDIIHRPDKDDPEVFYAEINRTAPLD